MIKALDYLYYKIYRATLKGSLKDIAEWAAAIYFGGLLFLNLFVFYALLRKLDLFPEVFSGIRSVVIVMVLLFLLSFLLFMRNKRYNEISNKYDQVDPKKSMLGTITVWTYCIVSILLMFIVAWYKPRKL